MKATNISSLHQQGFTLVELVATITIAALFLASVYLISNTTLSLSVASSRDNTASNIAYSNLRQYANGRSPSWFSCDPDNPLTPSVLINSSDPIDGLPDPVLQHVSATAPYGCGGEASGMPIRIESHVTYGPDARKITHASYASY